MLISVVARVIMKMVTDFTGMLHARHPYEMGGEFWLFNMIYTQASVFVVLWLRAGMDIKDDGWAFQQNNLWAIAGILLGLWLLAIVTLLQFSVKGFKHTFYQRLKAYEYSKAKFDTGEDEYR